jgi:hypothetical protein
MHAIHAATNNMLQSPAAMPKGSIASGTSAASA